MSDERGGVARAVPTGTTLLRNADVVATLSSLGDIQGASIFIRGNVIEWVGPAADLPEHLREADTVSSEGGRGGAWLQVPMWQARPACAGSTAELRVLSSPLADHRG